MGVEALQVLHRGLEDLLGAETILAIQPQERPDAIAVWAILRPQVGDGSLRKGLISRRGVGVLDDQGELELADLFSSAAEQLFPGVEFEEIDRYHSSAAGAARSLRGFGYDPVESEDLLGVIVEAPERIEEVWLLLGEASRVV